MNQKELVIDLQSPHGSPVHSYSMEDGICRSDSGALHNPNGEKLEKKNKYPAPHNCHFSAKTNHTEHTDGADIFRIYLC